MSRAIPFPRLRSATALGALWSGWLGVAVAALAAPAAFAQSDDLAAARACTGITADAARLACYDRAFSGNDPEAAIGGEGNQSGQLPGEASNEALGETRRAPSISTRTRETAPEPASFFVTVVEVRQRTTVNESVFVTDDGSVWVQTDARRAFLPSTPFRAEIRPGALGSYFLDPDGNGRAIRVRQR